MTKSKQYHRLTLDEVNWALRDNNLTKKDRIALLKAKSRLLTKRIEL